MINFKRIIYDIVVAVALAAALAAAAPAGGAGAAEPCRDGGEGERHYDQRQNGTENYRLNIDGVVIAVAPADSLLAAASEIDFADLLDLDDFNEIQPKPKPPASGAAAPAPEPEAAPPPPAGPAAAPAPAAGAPKSTSTAAHGKAHRKKGLKLRLAHLLLPLLKKSRHH